MIIISLNQHQLKFLENLLLNKDHINREINIRKIELSEYKEQNLTPEIKVKSVGSQVEKKALTFIGDPFIANRELWLKAIKILENSMDDYQQEVYQFKFIEYPYMSWLDVASELGYSKSSIYRIRYRILEKFNSLIGMY